MPAEWQIKFWPKVGFHAFLSHCQEDRDGLIVPIYQGLQERGIIPWIDRHEYPAGRDAFETLREEILRCRHVVYFITPACLRQGRGWMHIEHAYSIAIQQQLRYGTREIVHVELPLVFLDPSESAFQRSTWRSLVDKWRRCPISVDRKWWQFVRVLDDGCRNWTNEHVLWAVDQIESFIRQEQSWAFELGQDIGQDPRMKSHFSRDRNQLGRILGVSPPPIGS